MRALVLTIGLLSTLAARADEIILADGGTFRGTIQSIVDGQFEFTTPQESTFVNSVDLLRFGRFVDPHHYPRITLRDGSLLVVRNDPKPTETIQLITNEITVNSSSWRKLKITRDAVASILYRAVPQSLVYAATNEVLEKEDIVQFVDSDRIAGQIVAIQDGKTQVRIADDKIGVPLARVAAIQFATTHLSGAAVAGTATAKPRFFVGLRDGSMLAANDIQLKQTNATISLTGGGEVTLPKNRVVAIQVFESRGRYLSEIQPLAYRHTPYLSGTWPLGIDRNASQAVLHVGGSPFHRGIGMHSHSRVVFRLDGKYRRLLATLAVDDEAEGHGSVTYRVLTGDGTGSWQSAFESSTVRGGDEGIPLDVDVSGAKFVALIVDFADRADQRDLANWLDARVLP